LAYLADDILMMPPNEPAGVGITLAPAGLGGFARQYRAAVSYPTTSVVFAGWPPITEVLKGLHVDRRMRR
jgi:hypothetical protein